jgi:indolepyruvate ferredoxin oxidoreductase, beta subunit
MGTLPHTTAPLTLLVCALGGEGGGVLAQWLCDVARHSGHAAQATSVPGVAQRTGATTYYLEFAREPTRGHDPAPLFGLMPLPGRLDLLVSSELLETTRQIGHGMTSPEQTCVITSTARALTTQERMVPGDGRVDAATLLAVVREHAKHHHVLDMAAMTQDAGTVVSAVMLGAVAASGVLPFARAAYEAVVGGEGVARMAVSPSKLNASARASLAGFALAYEAVAAQRAQVAVLAQALAPTAAVSLQPSSPQSWPGFPQAMHERLTLGHARVAAYQDAAYAHLYLRRLASMLAVEQGAAGAREREANHESTHQATHECARWLALWMAFDDVVQVARLKASATRRARVQREVKARDDELLKVYDHFKPGVPELAGLLPERLAQALLARDARRVARGQEPWAMPLKIGTHTVRGMLALRLMACLRGWRRRGQRFKHEQQAMERWLQGVTQGLAISPGVGLEVARCGRLIKGYGATNARGKERLLHVLDHLLPKPGAMLDAASALACAQAVAAVREAALADESGVAFDAALVAEGAPARPLREQPVRWMKRRSVVG